MQEQIKNDLKEAMRAKDPERLTVIRGIMAAFTNELVSKGRTPQDKLSDEEAIAVVKRLAKQRRDSIEQYVKGDRDDLAQSERGELTILEEFLPEQMPEADIEKVVHAKKDELGVTDRSGTGELMKAVMAELKGKADGSAVKQAVDKVLGE